MQECSLPPTVQDGRLPTAGELQTGVVSREFEFPGDLASVPESREQVMQFVCQHCPIEADQIDILVALQEALANAALHGCGDDPAKRIQCNVAATARGYHDHRARSAGRASISHWPIPTTTPLSDVVPWTRHLPDSQSDDARSASRAVDRNSGCGSVSQAAHPEVVGKGNGFRFWELHQVRCNIVQKPSKIAASRELRHSINSVNITH